jgi:hypothetical protein
MPVVQLTVGLLLKNVREELAEEGCEMHSRERLPPAHDV